MVLFNGSSMVSPPSLSSLDAGFGVTRLPDLASSPTGFGVIRFTGFGLIKLHFPIETVLIGFVVPPLDR